MLSGAMGRHVPDSDPHPRGPQGRDQARRDHGWRDHGWRHRSPGLFHDQRQLRVGLFGGSFNPAHDGHLHLSDLAQRLLRLDEIWWIVSPQNPLKERNGMAPLPTRLGAARHAVGRRRVKVIAPEVEFRTSLTFSTLRRLRARCPSHSFIWLMGADNLVTFASWQRHDVIARTMPIAVIDRPGYSYQALSAGALLLRNRIPPRLMASRMAWPGLSGTWCFIAGRRHHASATALRQARRKSAKLERND